MRWGGVVGRHNQGLAIDSNGPDDASRPIGKLARFLSGQADELTADSLCPPAGGPKHGLEAIDHFLGRTVRRDYWTIFVVA